jgi:hypothetical protein
MFRRDEFLRRLDELNSSAKIDELVEQLENTIDAELNKDVILTKFINSISSGVTDSTSGVETLNTYVATDSVHKDLTVSDEDSSENKITDSNGNSYAHYKSGEVGSEEINLDFPNGNDASLTPWDDVALLNPDLIDGTIEIDCPVGTNKMVAYKLAQKYNNVDTFDDDGEPTSGFWSRGLKPNDSDKASQVLHTLQ